jgi:gamma-glutamyltranspeptidase/glutathione hydrolase
MAQSPALGVLGIGQQRGGGGVGRRQAVRLPGGPAGGLQLLLPVAQAQFKAGAVATSDAYSAVVAKAILQRGGNAVDAAVATAFALAVTLPEAGNLGGGGFMTVWMEGKPYFLDYRERAPAKASADMYLDEKGNVVPDLSLIGNLSAGIPGTVRGMAAVHSRFGRLPWKDVVAPAIALARDGFVVPERLQQNRDAEMASYAGKTNFATYYAGIQTGPVVIRVRADTAVWQYY